MLMNIDKRITLNYVVSLINKILSNFVQDQIFISPEKHT